MARKRSVASLSVSLTAKTAAFRKSMERALRSVKKFATGIKQVASRVAKLGFALTAVAVGGMAVFIKQSFKSLDNLVKFSDILKVSANSLRSLERAAELTGSSVTVLRKGLIRMSRGVFEASIGIGQAKQALEFMRLDIAKLSRLKADEMFLRIADALGKIPSRTQQIGLSALIFGGRGTELLNVADLGEKRLRAMRIESERISGILSRFDLFKIEVANDALADMRRSVRSIADFAAVRIAPLVEKISKNLTERFISIRKRLPELLASAKSMIVRFLNFIDREFRLLVIGILKSMESVVARVANILKASIAFRGTGKELGLVAGDLGRRAAARTLSLAKADVGGRLAGDRIAGLLNQTVQSALGQFNKLQAEVTKKAFFDWLSQWKTSFIPRIATAITGTTAAVAAAAIGGASRSRLSRPLTALQISPSRDFVPGIFASRNKAQLVQDPQLREVIRIMLEQNRLLQDQFFGVTT